MKVCQASDLSAVTLDEVGRFKYLYAYRWKTDYETKQYMTRGRIYRQLNRLLHISQTNFIVSDFKKVFRSKQLPNKSKHPNFSQYGIGRRPREGCTALLLLYNGNRLYIRTCRVANERFFVSGPEWVTY